MNYWKVSFLYPQLVHDYMTALTIAHTLANGIRIYQHYGVCSKQLIHVLSNKSHFTKNIHNFNQSSMVY